VEEEFDSSKCVLVGRVVTSRQILDSDHFIQGTFYTVRVEELLKGGHEKQVEIYDENSSGRFPMRVGGRYILFAYAGAFEGVKGERLAINSSGNSETMKESTKTLARVREITQAKAQQGAPANRR